MNGAFSLLLVVIALGIPAAFAAGMFLADRSSRKYWRKYKFCPTCERFGSMHPVEKLYRIGGMS